MELEISALKNKSAEELFSNYSIQQLKELKTRLSSDVNIKRSELRNLVGNNYRDLLRVADDIIRMNDMTNVENSKLVDLTFRKSKYEDKGLKNLLALNREQRFGEVADIKAKNRGVMMRSLVHDLNFDWVVLKNSLAELKLDINSTSQELVNTGTGEYSQSPAISESISNSFVKLSKQFFLLEHFFKAELERINKLSYTSIKFKSLKREFLQEIEAQVLNLMGDNEFEFSMNIIVSYIIVEKVTPFEALKWYLDTRFNRVTKFNLVTDFLNCLDYNYNTLGYLGIFKTKLSTALIRLIHNTNNANWIAHSNFKKWAKWLNVSADYKVDFPITLTDLKLAMDDPALEDELTQWKLKIGSLFHAKFKSLFEQETSLSSLTSILNKTLIGFKKFTSMVDLKYADNDDLLIQELIRIWKSAFLELLKLDLNQFDDIAKLVLENYNNVEVLQSIRTNNGLNLFKFTDISDIDFYISQISSPVSNNSTIELILHKLNDFKSTLSTILSSLQGLNRLSGTLNKPILSIDDHEDDEFWKETSNTLDNLVNESIEFIICQLNILIKQFMESVGKLVETPADVRSIRYFYIIRILTQLKEKIDLVSIYSSFETLLTNSNSFESLDLPTIIDQLLSKIYKPLTFKIAAPYQDQLKSIIETRFGSLEADKNAETAEDSGTDDDDSQGDKQTESEVDPRYPEIELWGQFDTKDKTPNCPSLEVENLVYKLSCNLISIDENPEEDFSDVYFSEKFTEVKGLLIDNLLNCIDAGLTKEKEQGEIEGVAAAESPRPEAAESQEEADNSQEQEADEPPKPEADEPQEQEADEKQESEANRSQGPEIDESVESKGVEPVEPEEVEPVESEEVESVKPKQAESAMEESEENEADTLTSSKSPVRASLTYADLVFLNCFKLSQRNEEELLKSLQDPICKGIIAKLSERNEQLSNSAFVAGAHRLVLEHFKSSMLMFGPLN